jgi:transcriptional regulatory protein RtcR
MSDKPLVVIGLVGTTLDAGAQGPRRWERWRPTISIFEHEDLHVSRLELLCPATHQAVVDVICKDIAGLSPETEIARHTVPMPNPWDFEEVWAALYDFARSYAFKPEEEEYWVHITTGTHVAQICLFLLTEAGFVPGKLLQTGPPARGEDEPRIDVIDLDLARYDRIASRFAARREAAVGMLKGGVQTRNAAFNTLMDRIERVAGASTAPILLTGPTGAGKSALARRIYELKKARRLVEGPLVEVNCATIRGDAAMSALFGHKKGAFTGATDDRKGLLLAANGGVLFLDEIGELGLDEQAMLLRAIEDKRFLPMGSDREVKSDFQLVAGTNRDLHQRVGQGLFREDLLARIDLWTFRLPGLADRPEDVEPNLDFELERSAARTGRQVRLNREARERFLSWAVKAEWKANFRDLDAAVTRMATLAEGGRIDKALVDEEIARLEAAWGGSTPQSSRVDAIFGKDVALDRFDRVQLEDVLAVCARSRSLSEAGRELFAVSRAQKSSSNDADRLRKYLARFGLSWADVRA